MEVTHGLFHTRVVEGTSLVIVELVGGLGDAESEGFVTESQVFCRDVTIKEDVDTLTNTVRQRDDTIYGRLAVKNADIVGEVVQNTKIVLNN